MRILRARAAHRAVGVRAERGARVGRTDGARGDARGAGRAVGRACAPRAACAVGVAAVPREPGVFVERAGCAGECCLAEIRVEGTDG